jgi:hypothetical protein
MPEFVSNFLCYLLGSLLMKIYVHMQAVESSNLWNRLLHEFIGISKRWIPPPPHTYTRTHTRLFHISLWKKVGKMNFCESINVANVKYRPNYITCYVGLPQPVFWIIYGLFCMRWISVTPYSHITEHSSHDTVLRTVVSEGLELVLACRV